ncbi:hypothetical protein QOZ80_2BG0184690 [Eleusine coracana subsp. coracana]|nr:hypothetical protein QOZ80_2BG0184690 [Eleusine coracana subsp. coracana]
MAEAKKAKAEALLLAFLVLTSCFVASSSSGCIPRRLLLVSGTYYYPAPCNDGRMDGPPKLRGSKDDGMAEETGSRKPKGPPSPTSYWRAMNNPAAAAAPGINN